MNNDLLSSVHSGHDIPNLMSFSKRHGPNYYQEIKVPFLITDMVFSSSPLPADHFLRLCFPGGEMEVPSSSYTDTREKGMQHQHNTFEFTYVLKGSMYQLVEGKQYFYPAGSCCLMNRNTLHTEETSTDFTAIFLSVSKEFLSSLYDFRKYLLFPGERNNWKDNLILHFFTQNLENSDADRKDFLDFIPKPGNEDQLLEVERILENLHHVTIQAAGNSTWQLIACLMKFFDMLGNEEIYNAEHVTAESRMEALLFARIDRVLSDRNGRISHRELAELLNYNGSYLGRIVKKYTGKSLFDYSMKYAMGYAARMLTDTDRSVADIAAELHFSNISHFYRLFREQYGVTPREYRKQKSPG